MAVNVTNPKNVAISLGRTLLIVNPVAQSGKGSKNGHRTFDLLREEYQQDVDLFYTKHDGHAMQMASDTAKYDAVIVVGGDGVVHETASGIMRLPKKDRPVMGVIPVGSGNDYARSLGMSFKVKKAVDQLMHSKIKEVDVGQCNDKFFVETLSFGIDAGIAIDTMKARVKSKEKGFKLYFKCGIDRIMNHFELFDFTAKLDRGRTINGHSLIFAIQIGKTYGGGFKITPDAELDDGYFNLCYSENLKSRKQALPLFARAAKGKHTSSNLVKFDKSKNIKLKIKQLVPCQLDGEEYSNKNFDIKTHNKALKVYVTS